VKVKKIEIKVYKADFFQDNCGVSLNSIYFCQSNFNNKLLLNQL